MISDLGSLKGGAGSRRIGYVMKYFGLMVLVLGLLVPSVLRADTGGWETLFNGRDFSGWKVPKDNIWWKVADGAIVVENGPKKKGSNLWTEKSFKNFEVELEFKFDGTGDSGVFLRSGKEQIQIGISGSLKRDMTCSPYIPGKGYPVEATASEGTKGVKGLLKINEWNVLKIRAVGPDYTVWLNGKEVMNYTSGKVLTKGPIGLQLHGNKVMKISFRGIKVKGV